MIDVALRDVETSVKNNHSVTSSIKQPPIQGKVQHTSPSILVVTKKPRPILIAFVHCTRNVACNNGYNGP